MYDLAEVRQRAKDIRSLMDPEWRYVRAKQLKSDGIKRFKRGEDRWVVLLTKFLKGWSDANEEQMSDLEYQFPDIFWAYKVHSAEGRGPRYHLEALVVSRMPVDQVSEYLGLPEAVIDAYERCFFDLRQHLDQAGALRIYITARARSRGMRDLDPDPFWKRIALAEGERFLFTLWEDGTLEEQDKRKFDDIIAAQSRRNAVEAMRVREVSPINAHEIMEEYVALCGNETNQERWAAELGSGGDAVHEFVAAMMRAVNFTIAPVSGDRESAYLEMTSALDQGPAILKRLQGAAAKKEKHDAPEQNSE